MQQQFDLFLSSLQAFWTQIAAFVPTLFAVLVLLLAGWLFARLVRSGVRRLLALTHFGKAAEKSGLEALLSEGGVHVSLAGVIAEVIYWLILLIVAVSVANSLGLSAVADLLNKVVIFLPNVVVAILILVFGTLLARFVNRVMFAWLARIKAPNALTVSTGMEYGVQVFALFVALEQLGVGTQLLTAAFSLAFGGLCLGLALAFGLGGRDRAGRALDRWMDRK